jgi:peptide/nickel transport system permease protein
MSVMTNNFVEVLKPRLKEMRVSFYLLKKNKLTMIAFYIIVLLFILAVAAPFIIPHPTHISQEANPSNKLQPPSIQYLFGTDEIGRDIFSRVIYGTRISLTTAILAVGLALLIGVPLGAVAGSLGGWIDEVIMRITDIFLSFPPLLLAIAIVSIVGPSLNNAIIAIALSWWPWYTRLVRGQAVSLKERKFVQAAEAIGTSKLRIIFGHIVPNTISPVIVQASMDMGGVILTISSLSFLGLGAQAPTPEWGLMISTSRNYFLNAWWYSIFPGLAIFITVLAFNLLGDGFREILDPKTRKN